MRLKPSDQESTSEGRGFFRRRGPLCLGAAPFRTRTLGEVITRSHPFDSL
jgi:hypothetical protein